MFLIVSNSAWEHCNDVVILKKNYTPSSKIIKMKMFSSCKIVSMYKGGMVTYSHRYIKIGNFQNEPIDKKIGMFCLSERH